MADYGEKLHVEHPSPDHAARVWHESEDIMVWEVTNLETGEQSVEKFKLVEED